MSDQNLAPEQLSKLDHTEFLVKKLFTQFLVSGTFMKKEGEKLVIQVFDSFTHDQVKKLLDQKLEEGNELVVLKFQGQKDDSWLSKMGDGRDDLDGESNAE